MRRSYATGYSWLLETNQDLLGAARRARAVARSLGWGAAEADALSLAVVELGHNAIRHGGGGVCRLEAGPEGAEMIVEDRGRGFPARVLQGALDDSRGLGAARQICSHLMLENVPGGGGRARASLSSRQAARAQQPAYALAG